MPVLLLWTLAIVGIIVGLMLNAEQKGLDRGQVELSERYRSRREC
jgi:hypothetical protein